MSSRVESWSVRRVNVSAFGTAICSYKVFIILITLLYHAAHIAIDLDQKYRSCIERVNKSFISGAWRSVSVWINKNMVYKNLPEMMPHTLKNCISWAKVDVGQWKFIANFETTTARAYLALSKVCSNPCLALGSSSTPWWIVRFQSTSIPLPIFSTFEHEGRVNIEGCIKKVLLYLKKEISKKRAVNNEQW